MRRNQDKQMPLSRLVATNAYARKFQVISDLLDEQPKLYESASKDISAGKNPDTGRTGMTGEQAVRAAILYRILGVPYVEFQFRIIESTTFRSFCRLPLGTRIGVSTLAENIKAIRPETWESIHEVLVLAAKKKLIPKKTAKLFESTALASKPTFTHPQTPLFCEIASVLSPDFRKK